jgi:MFS family permease
MINFIRKEAKAFDTFDKDGKRLIVVNILYAMVFPFIVLFSTAFVNRATGNQVVAIVNGFGFGIGLIFGNLTNGLLLRRGADIRYLFSVGMFLSIVSTFLMMMFVKPSIGAYIFFYGLFAGYGSGLYWSNRQFLSFLVTREENRNFYASLDQFFIIFFNAFIPFLFGTIIIMLGRRTGWFDEIVAYRGVAAVMVVLIVYAVFLVLKSNFKSPIIKKFTYLKFNKQWNTHRIVVFLVGFVQSGFMYFIPLLILNVAGDETVLGKIELTTALLSITVIYILGRMTAAKHRAKMMLVGAIFITLGGTILSFLIDNDELIWNMVKVSFLGVIIMKIFQVTAEPIINVSYSSTNLSDIEKATAIEKRDSYTYVFDNELFMNGGRIFGGLIFIAINYLLSPIGALQYIFIILGLFQLITVYLIKKLTSYNLQKTGGGNPGNQGHDPNNDLLKENNKEPAWKNQAETK